MLSQHPSDDQYEINFVQHNHVSTELTQYEITNSSLADSSSDQVSSSDQTSYLTTQELAYNMEDDDFANS